MTFARNLALASVMALSLSAFAAQAQQQPPAEPAPLNPAQVKTVIEGRLVLQRSDLKVGKVVEKDAKTYDVELLKADGTVQEHALVDKLFAHPAGALHHGPGHGGRPHMRGGQGPMGCGNPA